MAGEKLKWIEKRRSVVSVVVVLFYVEFISCKEGCVLKGKTDTVDHCNKVRSSLTLSHPSKVICLSLFALSLLLALQYTFFFIS